MGRGGRIERLLKIKQTAALGQIIKSRIFSIERRLLPFSPEDSGALFEIACAAAKRRGSLVNRRQPRFSGM
jgi:hypothetical protein